MARGVEQRNHPDDIAGVSDLELREQGFVSQGVTGLEGRPIGRGLHRRRVIDDRRPLREPLDQLGTFVEAVDLLPAQQIGARPDCHGTEDRNRE
jgi:hypothetical protein